MATALTVLPLILAAQEECHLAAGTPSPTTQLAAANAQVTALQGQLATANTTIATLNGQVTALGGQVATLTQDLANRTAERDAAELKAANAVAAVDQLTTLDAAADAQRVAVRAILTGA